MVLGDSALASTTIADTTTAVPAPTITPDLTYSSPYGAQKKHRLDQTDIGVAFTDLLNSGETIDTIDTLDITPLGQKTSVASEFGSPSGEISGDEVRFRLSSPSSGDQARGYYEFLVVVTTSEDDVTAAMDDTGSVPRLEVIDSADTTAP